MNMVQGLMASLLPKKWAADMEAESRLWMMQCACGFERSIWELGGVRWKAAGRQKRFRSCPRCGQNSWHTVYRKQENAELRKPVPL